MIPDIVIVSIGVAVFALLITAAVSPLETLSWWAGWTEDEIEDEGASSPDVAHTAEEGRFVVYLSGVATLSGDHLIARERIFIARLRDRLPDASIITDVFPYSPAGLPLLAGPRILHRLWRWLQKRNLQGKRTILKFFINVRNIYQVMVAADHRYGPIYGQGAASTIEQSLRESGYKRGSGAPVAIIGYSGGAQVALAAAPFLIARLGCPVDVVSIGGVVASDPGVGSVRRLIHLFGDKDRIEKIGAVVFAERWGMFANSHWNTAKRQGRLRLQKLGKVAHAGPLGYFGLPKQGAQSPNERTVDIVAAILSENSAGGRNASAP